MTIAHDVEGSGPAVVLLHAGVADRRMWDPQWPALVKAGYRAVRCDLRGFGDSPISDRPYSNAGDVVALLDALGIERAALVAASAGGREAIEIAARWPDRVTALALLCTALSGREPSPELRAFGDQEDALLEAGDIAAAVDLNVETFTGPEAGPEVRERVRLMQRRAFDLQLTAEVMPDRPEIDLSAVRAPCLAVSGAHDLPDFRTIAADLPHLLPDAHHVELPWAGHLPSMERPDEVTELLLDFLAAR